MTVIVAVEHSGGVVVGCDSFFGGRDAHETLDRPKWFTNGPCLVAFAGSVRGAQVAEHWLKTFRSPRRNESDESYLVTVVASSIRQAHEQVGGESEKLVEQNGSAFLVAFRCRAFVVQGDYSVVRARRGYTAVGAGDEIALGALAATEGIDARERVMRALRAAARHCNMVASPFHVIEIPART